MSWGVVGGRCGWDLAWLWLWLAAVGPIRPLAWEPPYAAGAALKSKKEDKPKTEPTKEYKEFPLWLSGLRT